MRVQFFNLNIDVHGTEKSIVINLLIIMRGLFGI